MAFKNILITGAGGMLGQDLTLYLHGKGFRVSALQSDALNLLHSAETLKRTIALHEPEIIVHCAAYTDVDGAEQNPELASAINTEGTRKLAQIAHALGVILAYVSTDYVFDGTQQTPYTPQDPPNPISTYGQTKYQGELQVQEIIDTHYILRTSWLYGIHRRNFVQFVLESAKQGQHIRIVNDWTGSPTWTGSLSDLITRVITSGEYGVHHVADAGAVTKYEQAIAVCKAAGLSPYHIQPASWREFAFAARRPAYSVLDCSPLAVPTWKTSLEGYLTQYTDQSAG